MGEGSKLSENVRGLNIASCLFSSRRLEGGGDDLSTMAIGAGHNNLSLRNAKDGRV